MCLSLQVILQSGFVRLLAFVNSLSLKIVPSVYLRPLWPAHGFLSFCFRFFFFCYYWKFASQKKKKKAYDNFAKQCNQGELV